VDMLESGPHSGSRAGGSRAPRWRLAAVGGAGTARGVAVAAGLALLAAEVLPWGTLGIKNNPASDGNAIDLSVSSLAYTPTVHAVQLPAGIAVAFQLGWALLLAALAVALFGPLRLRRAASAAAAGLAVAEVALIAGVIGSSSDTPGMLSLFGAGPVSTAADDFAGHQGPGMFCAGLGALLALFAAGALVRERGADDGAPAAAPGHRGVQPANAWRPAPGMVDPADPQWPGAEPVGAGGNGYSGATERRGRHDAWDEDELGPADLTVTALPPSGYRRPGP
jgi:hypothetical protein